MVGHIGVHHHLGLATALAGRRVVDGFEKAELAESALPGQALQILAGGLGSHHQRQRRSIGGDDQILGQTAFQAKTRHAESAVLVIQVHIDGVVARFRNSPGHAALAAILDLPGNRCLAGLVEQRIVVARHDQHRHQVLEHRTAP